MKRRQKPNMDAELIEKYRAIMRGKPSGGLTRLHGDKFVDESGRLYQARTLEQLDAGKRAANIGKDTRHFSFSHMENMREVIATVPTSACGHLLHLQCYMELFTGILTKEDGDPMYWDDIQSTIKISDRSMDDFKRDMTDAGIIEKTATEDGEVALRINPRYHFRNGLPENSRVIKSFTKRVKELAEELTPHEVGMIYKLLPYVHQNTNTICANPFEKDPTKIEQLTGQQIAKLIGVSPSKMSRYLQLTAGDQYVFAKVIVGRKRYYKLNPWIFYRKNGRPDDTLLEMFAVKAKRRGR